MDMRGFTVVRILLLPVATGVMLDIQQLGGISPVVTKNGLQYIYI